MTASTSTTADLPNRRSFVLAGAGVTLAGLTAIAADTTPAASPSKRPLIQPGDTVLFQGDSITDANRKRDDSAVNSQPAFGTGYAWLIASQLLIDRPDDDLKFYNRGIAGNKVFEMADRWQADCLDLKPNVVSILIGVNDFWHKHKYNYSGTVEKYQTGLIKVVKQTKDVLPQVRFIICEPFELNIATNDPKLSAEFDGYRAAARRVAEETNATFVPFDAKFRLASKVAPPLHWAPDGVHPAPDGSALMAHWWLEAANG
jgi:lysophospholipase L1-like esterase